MFMAQWSVVRNLWYCTYLDVCSRLVHACTLKLLRKTTCLWYCISCMYTQKIMSETKLAICNHQADSPLYVYTLCLIWCFASLSTEMSIMIPDVINETRHRKTLQINRHIGPFKMLLRWIFASKTTNITCTALKLCNLMESYDVMT